MSRIPVSRCLTALSRRCAHTVRPRHGQGRQVVPLPLAERLLLHLLTWQKCAREFMHVAARLDYDDEFRAYTVYEETEAAVAAWGDRPVPGARPQMNGESHDYLQEMAEALLISVRADRLDLLLPAEIAEKLLECLAAWESCAGRMRDFIADVDFYDDYGVSSRHAATRAEGLEQASAPLPLSGTYRLPPDLLAVS